MTRGGVQALGEQLRAEALRHGLGQAAEVLGRVFKIDFRRIIRWARALSIELHMRSPDRFFLSDLLWEQVKKLI
jgi:hypothetical protein